MKQRMTAKNLGGLLVAFVLGVVVSHISRPGNAAPNQPGTADVEGSRPKAVRKLDTRNWAEAVPLPGTYAMPVSKLLYSSEKPTENNFMGDGFSAYVVSVDKNDMQWFLENLTGSTWDWRKGEFYPGHMDAYRWVMEWMGDEEKVEFAKVVDMAALIKKSSIIHRQDVEENSSGKISNVRMWVIDPDKNIIVFLNEDT